MALGREDPAARGAGRRLGIAIAGLVGLALAELAVYWTTTVSVRREDPDLFAEVWHTVVTATAYTLCREVPHLWVLWRTRQAIDRLAASFVLWYDGAGLLLSVWTFVPKVLAWLRLAPGLNPFAVSQAAAGSAWPVQGRGARRDRDGGLQPFRPPVRREGQTMAGGRVTGAALDGASLRPALRDEPPARPMTARRSSSFITSSVSSFICLLLVLLLRTLQTAARPQCERLPVLSRRDHRGVGCE